MNTIKISTTLTFTVLECSGCGIGFAMSEQFEKERRRDHKYFYCPNGHSQYFPAKSTEEVLRDEKARLTAQLDQERAARVFAQSQAETAERKAVRAKRKVARVNKGVCPDCNRSFTALARHMKTKHGK